MMAKLDFPQPLGPMKTMEAFSGIDEDLASLDSLFDGNCSLNPSRFHLAMRYDVILVSYLLAVFMLVSVAAQ